jgi:hypothetical protein
MFQFYDDILPRSLVSLNNWFWLTKVGRHIVQSSAGVCVCVRAWSKIRFWCCYVCFTAGHTLFHHGYLLVAVSRRPWKRSAPTGVKEGRWGEGPLHWQFDHFIVNPFLMILLTWPHQSPLVSKEVPASRKELLISYFSLRAVSPTHLFLFALFTCYLISLRSN